jgi:hypothetical protein
MVMIGTLNLLNPSNRREMSLGGERRSRGDDGIPREGLAPMAEEGQHHHRIADERTEGPHTRLFVSLYQ